MATRILLSEMVGALRKLLMVAQFLLYLKKITYLDVDHAMIEADIFTHFIINLISPSCPQLLSDTGDKKKRKSTFFRAHTGDKKKRKSTFFRAQTVSHVQ